MNETDMFPYVESWLMKQGYEVYTEIEPVPGGRRADIIATKGDVVMAVELKLSFGITILNQAYLWLADGWVNKSMIVLPELKPQNYKGYRQFPEVAVKIIRDSGIGVCEVDMRDLSVGNERVTQRIAPMYRPDAKALNVKKMRSFLSDHHKNGIGGRSDGKRVTTFQLSMFAIRDYLLECGEWRTAKQIDCDVVTHYRGANVHKSIAQALKMFCRDWVDTKIIGRTLHFKAKGADE